MSRVEGSFGSIRIGESGQVRSINKNWFRSGQVESIKIGWVGSGWVSKDRLGRVRSGQMSAGYFFHSCTVE